MERLKRRAEFLAVRRGRRADEGSLVVEALERPETLIVPGLPANAPRFGFTVTKKVGNSVVRNRIRRRLREAVRQTAANAAPGTDYVLVARQAALSRPFARLLAEVGKGLSRAPTGRRARPAKPDKSDVTDAG